MAKKKEQEEAVGCARPTGGPVGEEPREAEGPAPAAAPAMTMKLGHKAPDFVAPCYHKGKFSSVKLSDHLGKWVVLCFYPGDFTFV
jgi:peroxiredoxin (alkyl hydroperoxide reductase subunit C)